MVQMMTTFVGGVQSADDGEKEMRDRLDAMVK